ncbi:hypothetical protein FocTR4_00008498 [Fusarium oxysporum f. sp. cubense]|uniref:Uncharacterized protein n=1 Tax=Fusarium oxysporum f. sp. cubense TaxID=61366 RepID=A0A5C6STW1_FUSOC|nr:hypothetical protein FocTR4_00008498 [Fusarium oxysporum f. sp. cubense]
MPLRPGPSGRFTKFSNRGALPSLWIALDGQVKTKFEIVSLLWTWHGPLLVDDNESQGSNMALLAVSNTEIQGLGTGQPTPRIHIAIFNSHFAMGLSSALLTRASPVIGFE